MNAFIGSLITEALNTMLRVLSDSLLSTPDPADLPALVEIWTGSWQIVLAAYGLLVTAAGILIMAYQTVQTRYSARELIPRIVLGFLAGAMSLTIASLAITTTNAITAAILNTGVTADGEDRSAALGKMITTALLSGPGVIFLQLIAVAICVALLVLLLTYIVRVAFTIILVAAAPIVLMFHALPHTDGIARWWWRSFAACLGIQLAQSLTLVVALRVLLTPGNPLDGIGDQVSRGLITLLVVLALFYILVKIPFWLLSVSKVSGGRSFLGSLVRSYLAVKSFGLLKGAAAGGGRRPRPPGGPAGGDGRDGPRGGPPDPYSRVRARPDGQLMLPLPGLTRGRVRRPTPPPAPTPPNSGQTRVRRGRQLALPLLEGDWPENRPVLGADGQYRLPFNITRTTPPPAPTATPRTPQTPSPPQRRGRQLELQLDPRPDPFTGNRPLRGGQYPLPLEGLTSRPRRPIPPAPPPPAPPRRTGPRARQLPLPLEHPDLPAPRPRRTSPPPPPTTSPPTTPSPTARPSSTARRPDPARPPVRPPTPRRAAPRRGQPGDDLR